MLIFVALIMSYSRVLQPVLHWTGYISTEMLQSELPMSEAAPETLRAKKTQKFILRFGVATKSDFVFTQPGSEPRWWLFW